MAVKAPRKSTDQDAIEAARLERIATCEQQLAEDRDTALNTLKRIGMGIAAWNDAGWQYEGKPDGEPGAQQHADAAECAGELQEFVDHGVVTPKCALRAATASSRVAYVP